MFNHRDENYQCPFCGVVAGEVGPHIYTHQEDIFYQDNIITAFISSHWFKKNPGHVLIIPNEHYENIYDIPDNILSAVQIFSKKIAVALKEVYGCDGVSTKQHNEPHGGQDVFHYHPHVYPRYENDNLYLNDGTLALSDKDERASFAQKLRAYFEQNGSL